MINKLFQGFFNLLWGFVGIFTTPISDFLTSILPDFSNTFATINSFLNSLAAILSWFIYLIPRPFALSVLVLFLYVVIGTQTIVVFIKLVSWVVDLIKRVWVLGGK